MDKIIIKDLTVFAHHGVLKEENSLGQKFIVSCILELDTRNAGISDNIEKTVSYASVCRTVTEAMQNETVKLIEAAAEKIAARILLTYPLTEAVTVKAKKPWAPIGLPVEWAGVEIRRSWHTVYLSLGSNLGDRHGFLDMGLKKLEADRCIKLLSASDIYETKPVGYTDQPDFLNSCVCIKTLYEPEELLAVIHSAENEAGRERKIHWGPRTLDIDILLYDDLIIMNDLLTVPHPEMKNREFVLYPLSQIAPYKQVPTEGKTVIKLLEELRRSDN